MEHAPMRTYKLCRMKEGKLYPLFVEAGRELSVGQWLEAHVGEKADERHVKSRLGILALRPGFHSCEVPFTDWIGKRQGDRLVQRDDNVWCECEVEGAKIQGVGKRGLLTIPEGWYYYRTKPGQPFPWIISDRIKIDRVLTHAEVEQICREHGVEAQEMEV